MSIPIQVTPRILDPVNSVSPQGPPIDAVCDHMGGMVFSQLFGRYYNLCRAGLLFVSGLNGGAIPIVGAGTQPTFCWWNPASSGINMVPIRFTMAYSGGGGGQVAGVNSGFLLKALYAGDEVGAGNAPLTSFTPVVYDSTNNQQSKNRFISAANIGGTGPTDRAGRASKVKIGSAAVISSNSLIGPIHTFPISQQAVATTGTSVIGPLLEDFDGTMIIAPGTFVCLSTDSVASGDKWNLQLIWAEVPL